MVTPTGSETYTCSAQRTWKDDNGGVQIPVCLPVCGNPNNPVQSSRRIILGKKADAGNFPWQVLLVTNGRGGGVLIGEQWVLTAAHVLISEEDKKQENDTANMHVFMGKLDVRDMVKVGNYPVESFHVHPSYRPGTFDHDIGLIRLRDPIVMNQNVSPICLPLPEDEDYLYQADRNGYVSGFGRTENNTIANKLRYVNVPVASRQECQNFLDRKKSQQALTRNMFCAGFPESSIVKSDACEGDSGGGYTTNDRQGNWVVTGLVSWGIDCGKGYGIYTKASNYLDWIQSYMGEEVPLRAL
ncbi:hypothetical protein GDO86_013637 [Hymenochirus boettgeri]|uniref:Peptidase S1 domain-containing protein n=1 Tax=Hymenochirus boettgeri TaxID=247094 RepID=A0A8T2IXL9_9PIPI|nr:hypothetical protein GDO86_013637 [Hymenochirus boettgeri]